MASVLHTLVCDLILSERSSSSVIFLVGWNWQRWDFRRLGGFSEKLRPSVVPTGNKITRITHFSTQMTVTMIFLADATLLNLFFLGSVMWHYSSSCCFDWGSEWWMQVFPRWQHMTGSLYLQCCVGAKDQWWLLSLSLHVHLSAFMAGNK